MKEEKIYKGCVRERERERERERKVFIYIVQKHYAVPSTIDLLNYDFALETKNLYWERVRKRFEREREREREKERDREREREREYEKCMNEKKEKRMV